MRNRCHVQVDRTRVTARFRAKVGTLSIDLTDRRLAKIIQRCQDIPGCELFQYVDGGDGEPHNIDSTDVNEYLREISCEEFTAKDFRTWAGTVLASAMLREFEAFESWKASEEKCGGGNQGGGAEAGKYAVGLLCESAMYIRLCWSVI